MTYTDITNLVNEIPHTLLVVIVCAMVYLFIKLGLPLYVNIKESIMKKYNHNKIIFERGTEYLLSNALHDLGQIIKHCFAKGGKTLEDVFNYGEVRHHYKALEGNKVLDMLDYIFIHEIPFMTTLEVPQKLGNNQPPKETIDTMLKFYQMVKDNIVPPDEVKIPKNKLKESEE